MLFNSFEYVLFLVIVFAAFWGLMRARVLRTLVLLAASYVFYMSWSATFIFLIVGSTVLDYFLALWMSRSDCARRRKALVTISVVANLGLLGLFKYADFCLVAVSETLAVAGLRFEPGLLRLTLPVGISFYTFQTLSYTIDVYRRRIQPTSNFVEFATFVSFFPQLVAGPIVRANEFLPQFNRTPRLSSDTFGEGLFLIFCGMCKKILIADFLAVQLIDGVFDNPQAYSAAEVWVAVYGYTWQLYGDFSGYTDIARGSAKLFGFELPENFDRPFTATGPIEFWKRWHMTLSRWVQDYVYIPLGGSRYGGVRTYFNLFASFFLIGIWHGAGWTFVLFGLWHAFGVTFNRLYRRNRRSRVPLAGWKRKFAVFCSVHFYVIHWPIFRAPDVDRMWEVYTQMFTFDVFSLRIAPAVLLVVIGMFVIHFTPKRWVKDLQAFIVGMPEVVKGAAAVALAIVLMHVGSQQAAPFIYFQF